MSKYIEQTNRCREEVKEALRTGLPIVYCDETMFTKRTYATHDYGLKHKIVEVDEAAVYTSYVAALAAVSAEKGLELLRTYDGPVNSELFSKFLKDLSVIRRKQPFALFMDNASFHKNRVVSAATTELKITVIWNVPYSPEYNPIEGCFSIVKNHFKGERLNAMRNERFFSF